jgi:hypothetical protein
MNDEEKKKYAILGCGHKVEWKNVPRRPYAIKNVIGGVHTISWLALCKQCYKDQLELGNVLLTVKQQEDWTSSGKKLKPNRNR